MRNLKVAAVQVRCEPLRTMENLAHAEVLVEQAASEGAKLVLLPELMPGGYLLTEDIWKTAERFNGPSVAWLKRTANHHAIYLGRRGILPAESGNLPRPRLKPISSAQGPILTLSTLRLAALG